MKVVVRLLVTFFGSDKTLHLLREAHASMIHANRGDRVFDKAANCGFTIGSKEYELESGDVVISLDAARLEGDPDRTLERFVKSGWEQI